jgi:hypothetical protein
LNPPSDWFVELGSGESCNISHGHLDEVKEIVKKLGDDPFGNERILMFLAVRRNAQHPIQTMLWRECSSLDVGRWTFGVFDSSPILLAGARLVLA